jgi:hypothetical protein
MIRNAILTTGLALIALLPGACTDNRPNPAAPNRAGSPMFDRDHERDDDDDDDRRFLRLVSVVGPGKGRFRATRVPHPTIPGNFAVHIEVRLRHAKQNTTYVVQRAAEAFAPPGAPAGFDVSTTTDGSCQRGLFLPPWSTLSPTPALFNTVPDQGTGSPTITTDHEGNGAADFLFAQLFPLPLFDVMFRVLESGPTPTSALVTDCTNLPLLP